MDVQSHWERHAAEWIAWARAPGHDPFWRETWPALRTVLPPPGGLALDLGCGEGRSSRELAALGWRVVGVDRSPTLVRAAAALAGASPVVCGEAAALPLADGSVDLVLACMSLHDVDDFAGTVTEVGRVLRPSGTCCAAIVHPFATAQDDETLGTDEFRVSRPYRQVRRYADRIERAGFGMTFVSVHRPLEAYFSAFHQAGLGVRALQEHGDKRVPWLLVLRAEKA